LVPFYSKSKEGITSVVKKERRRDKIKSIGTGRFPRSGQWRNCCQSMVESRGSDSNVELNDTRSNQTSSSMYSHLEESNYMKKLLKNTKKKERGRDKIKSTGNGMVPKISQ
jgi:hypothetical protein